MSEIKAFLGRVISQFLCLKFQKFYAFESIGVNGRVCVPEIIPEIILQDRYGTMFEVKTDR